MADLGDFGKYRLLSELAKGGMAEIFLAERRDKPGEQLVIKRLLPHLAAQPDFVSMFLDEARIAAKLSHPNVVGVEDLGQIEGAYFTAMPYVHGADIRRIYNQAFARQRALPLSCSVRVIVDAARGLHYAHTLKDEITGEPLGLVHRDVSPQNIIVGFDGLARVLDFGVAKIEGKVGQTQAGVLKGKYSYMSPEQADGAEVDHRTDIFALGIILYETTTGTRLFKRKSELATLQAVLDCEVPSPSATLPAYPKELEETLRVALAKDPKDRFQDAGALASALEAFLGEEDRAGLCSFMQELFGETAPEGEPGRGATQVLAEPAQLKASEEGATQIYRAGGSAVEVVAVEEEGGTAPLVEAVLDEAAEPAHIVQEAELVEAAPAQTPGLEDLEASVSSLFPPEDEAATLAIVRAAKPAPQPPPPPPSAQWLQRAARRPLWIAAAALSFLALGALIALALRPPPAQVVDTRLSTQLVVQTEPGATLWYGDARLGEAGADGQAGPFWVRAGSAELKVALPARGFSRVRALRLERNRRYELEVLARYGSLRLLVAPWAKVTIDGRALGLTPLPPQRLMEGRHELILENEELRRAYEASIQLGPGQELELKVDMAKEGRPL